MAINAAASAAGAAVGTALVAGEAVASAGQTVAGAAPDVGALTRAAIGIGVEALGGPPSRRVSTNGARRWIEVRGLHTERGADVGAAVRAAVCATPGVRQAVLNTAASRIVVTVDEAGPSATDLCAVVADAERSANTAAGRSGPASLPGDDAVLIARTAAAAVAAASVGLAVTCSVLRLRGITNAVAVPAALFDQTPRLRREIEQRLGPDATDLLFAVVNSTSAALTASPTAAAAEAAGRAMLAAEAWNARCAWQRHEPVMSDDSAPGGARRLVRADTAQAEGSADRYANRASAVGVGAAAALGVMTRNAGMAGAAVLVAMPKSLRTSREGLGCALTRGLHTHHHALVLSPRALRMLDRVDALVVDPRALYTEELMISRVRGLSNSDRATAWEAARVALDAGRLGPGWHPMSSIPGAGDTGEALVSSIRDPYASALLAEARRAKLRVVSIDDDGLRSLAQGFDDLRSVDESVDVALAAAVDALAADGATVALVTSPQMRKAHAAHMVIGVQPPGQQVPWGSDVVVSDLTGAWRLLHALPVARRVSDKAVQLAASTSAIGALMLVPGVVGNGPASISAGAAAGLWNGFAAGTGVFHAPLPLPEAGHDWHALPVAEVRRLLPRPDNEAEPPTNDLAVSAPVHRLCGVALDSLRTVRDFLAEVRRDLDDPITPLLVTGAAASALLGSPVDAVLVSSVLAANAAVSAEQQLLAEHTIRRLLAVQEPLARRRVGPLEERRNEKVPADRLSPGDIIEVVGGEVVPADARLLEAANIEVDESTLTGESLPVAKDTAPTPGAPLAERMCMLYGGTTMLSGSGVAVVTAVGAGTEMRRAMAMAPRKSAEIGLHAQLRHITKRAMPISISGGALVGLLGILRGTPLRRSLAEAVSVIVAAVPEGLPLVATLAQLAAARKLTDKAVLVRNPHSVEAFARLDVVCFDKTGTLSENRLQVKSTLPLSGYTDTEVLATAARTTFARPGHRAEHATDDAIRTAVDGVSAPNFDEREAFLPFQSDRPFAAALIEHTISIKGAPELISSALTDDNEHFSKAVDEMSTAGLRVLAVAERHLDAEQAAAAKADPNILEELCRSRLTPVGLLGLADTPRAAARSLLTELTDRGIGVRLITGDHPVTAKAVAAELGLAVSDDEVMTGTTWETLSAHERTEAVTKCQVFARMTPENKIDVVQTLEAAGLVTAMVGDGANDAAAIRAASVGVGVVARGSDPARTAADVMLLDGRIEALLDAIDEGHQLWRRVHSAVSVLLGGNAGEICFALLTTLLTGDSALNTRQMLLVNLLTDALPAAALAVSDQTRTGEVYHDETTLWRDIGVRGAATTGGATLAWLLARPTGTARHAATVALIGLVGTQLMQTVVDSNSPAVVMTSLGSFVVMGGVISTPGLSRLFGCTPVGPVGWSQGLLAAAGATALSAFAPGVLSRIVDQVQSRLPARDGPASRGNTSHRDAPTELAPP
ncbi:cation-translocating P-type ATPase [Mycolicibacterium wolinskyi]|nr:cation-translocating P-type ATPase [Mycolicibacterium wolinskyi]